MTAPEKMPVGETFELAVDANGARPNEVVAFTVTDEKGEIVISLSGAVKEKRARASWTVDPNGRPLPLKVKITASLRGREELLGESTVVSGARASTLGWRDAQNRVLPVDPDAKMAIVEPGETVTLVFDVDDGRGQTVKEPLAVTLITETDKGSGFVETGREVRETKDVKRFEPPLPIPADAKVPLTLRIKMEARRKGETGPPTLGPQRTSPPLRIAFRKPIVTSFLGGAAGAKGDPAEGFVALGAGAKLRVGWEVQGTLDALRLEPGAIALPAKAKGTTEIDPATNPPAPDGTYSIVASNHGVESSPLSLGVIAVTQLTLRLAAGQPGKRLTRGKGNEQQVETDHIDGVAKRFTAANGSDFIGQITPRSRVQLAWKVVGAGDRRVALFVKGRVLETVAPEGTTELADPDQSDQQLNVELRAFGVAEPDAKAQPVALGAIRLREDRPRPEIVDFAPAGLDDKGRLPSDRIKFRWQVTNAAGSRLLVSFVVAGKSFAEPAPWNDPKLKDQTVETTPTSGPFKEGDQLEVKAELRNSQDELANEGLRGTRTLTVPVGPPAVPPPPKPLLDPEDPAFLRWFTPIAPNGKNHLPPVLATADVKFFINGPATFASMRTDLDAAKDEILILGFETGPRCPMGGSNFTDILTAASKRGVKIRGAFFGDSIRKFFMKASAKENKPVVDMINSLPTGKAFLDDHCGFTGAHHQKVVAIRSGDHIVAYCGCTDIEGGRSDEPSWHDVACRYEGPAAVDLYRTAVERIHDNQKNEEAFAPVPPQAPGSLAVQIVRTYRDLHIDPNAPALEAKQPPLPFAPNGEQGVYQLILKALEHTEEFIYLEDQFFVCHDAKLMAAMTRALKKPTFKAFIANICAPHHIHGTLVKQSNARRQKVIDTLTAAAPDKVILTKMRHHYVHAKLWVFDDRFAIVGSSNFNNRGYFSDSEIGGGIADRNEGGKGIWFAHQLRIALWKKHLGLDERALFEVNQALIDRWRLSTNPLVEPYGPDPGVVDESTSDILWGVADPLN